MSHTLHCPLTDIRIHFNQDWSGEAIICVRNLEFTVVAHSLLLGIPIIIKYPAPAAVDAVRKTIDHTILQRAISMAVERYMRDQFESGVENLIDTIDIVRAANGDEDVRAHRKKTR